MSGRTTRLLQELFDIRQRALTDFTEPVTMEEAKRYERLVERVIGLMEDPQEPYGGPPQDSDEG